ncbi:hypothetical protein V491_04656, partial [Pseudogymnoascus sp. VKM F-3775]
AVNVNVLASRGLAVMPTTEEIAAVEASVVEARNNRPQPPPKTKKVGEKPAGIVKSRPDTKKKETRKERSERKKKEKEEAARKAAKAAKKAAKRAAEAEAMEKAIEAVEAAKAAEAAAKEKEKKAKEKREREKKGKEKKQNKTKSPSHETGGPLQAPSSTDPEGSGSGGSGYTIGGTELQRRLEGVDWVKLGEGLSKELFKFVRLGGTVAEWEHMRAKKKAYDGLLDAIGLLSSESGEEGIVEDADESSEEYKDAEEEIVEEDADDSSDEYQDAERGTDLESEGEDKETSCPGPPSDSRNRYEPETRNGGRVIFCPGPPTDSENGGESGSENDSNNWVCGYRPFRYNFDEDPKPSNTQGGSDNTKPSGLDAKKSTKNEATGKKRKPEDSPEPKSTKKAKLSDYPAGTVNKCWWPRNYSKRRDIGATTSLPGDPSEPKNPPGTKRKHVELPEGDSFKRVKRRSKVVSVPPEKPTKERKRGEKREGKIIPKLPLTSPKTPKTGKHDGGIIRKIPKSCDNSPWGPQAKNTSDASTNVKKNSRTKRKSIESVEEMTPKSAREKEPKGSKEGTGKRLGWLW